MILKFVASKAPNFRIITLDTLHQPFRAFTQLPSWMLGVFRDTNFSIPSAEFLWSSIGGSTAFQGDLPAVLFDFRLPALIPAMSTALVECLHADAGCALTKGGRLLDLSVDLSSAFAQDCPPISYYRVVALEPVWLRKLAVAAGTRCDLGSLIAIFSTLPDEPLDEVIARPIRVTTAAILHNAGMWTGSTR